MEIDIKLNKDFERALEVMQDQYGEDFEKLNGFHESNLNYSDFVDGFIDKNNKKAVADTTIDGNANATTRDICSLLNERGKPEDKLFVFNKIFYELKQKNGLTLNGQADFISMMLIQLHSSLILIKAQRQ